jgi:hypothetical protein
MMKRCYSRNDKRFQDYGGRGIRVAPQWHTIEGFVADMDSRPSPQHSLDRIDNDGHYEPGNVRWATALTQGPNRRPRLKHSQAVSLNGLAPEDQQAVRELVESLRQKERAA